MGSSQPSVGLGASESWAKEALGPQSTGSLGDLSPLQSVWLVTMEEHPLH